MDNIYKADRWDGTYKNPIIYGNFADPSIIRDGDNYYMVHGGTGYRSMLMWHSRDLVNWRPLYYVLEGYEGNVWAPELIKYKDTYYIYNYGPDTKGGNTWVTVTKDIKNGPWSEPASIGNVEGIDPGHVIGEDGKRYVFMSKNIVYPLSDDGLKVTGQGKKVCDDWPIPDDWDIEGVCTESPKLLWKAGWCYLTVAEGGTFGPPTSHSIISFRSKSIFGPWEPSPYNPVSHTKSREETWWSKGHGTLIDTPLGDWYIVYHGILNNKRYHGRMTLMEPVKWSSDDWFYIPGNLKTDSNIKKPASGEAVTCNIKLSDDFKSGKLGLQWNLINNEAAERISFSDEGLVMKCYGLSLHDTSPLLCWNQHDSVEVVTELTVQEGSGGGMTFYYGNIQSCGIALADGLIKVYNMGKPWMQKPVNCCEYNDKHIFFKLKNISGIVSPWYSREGVHWTKINICFDVTNWNKNSNSGIGYGWVRPGLFAFGKGSITFHQFIYHSLHGVK